MINSVILNHHSLPFFNKLDADAGLLIFFDILKMCQRSGMRILLVGDELDKSLMNLELAEGYFIRDWFNLTSNVSKLIDERRFLKLIETKQPLFETIHINDVVNKLEVGLHNEALGKPILLAAYYFDTFLISFNASPFWNNSHINVWVFDVDFPETKRNAIILNLSDHTSLAIHKDQLTKRRNNLLSSAKDIWMRRTTLFPNIRLLSNQIGSILQCWSGRNDILFKARDALNILNLFCEKWAQGEYVEYRHEYLKLLGLTAEVSSESQSVKNDPKKSKERMFWLDDGRFVYCEHHVKLPNGYRMHFYADSKKKIIYVAYLGPHLSL